MCGCYAMKAQSAIEYLVTYGWMLIVVSIVSGAAYSTMGAQCVESTSGFNGRPVQITNFGAVASNNNLSLQLEHRRTEEVVVKEARFIYDGEVRQVDLTEVLRPYEAGSVGIPGFRESDSCNTIEVELIYDFDALKNQKVSGEITADLEFDDTVPPINPASFNAAYPDL